MNELAKSSPPEINLAIDRYNSLIEFTKIIMKKDVDFGIIPGSTKPTLLKPGAEKLRTFFGLEAPTVLVDKTEDWDKGFFSYNYRTDILVNGRVVASCEANCNSMEKKYHYRNLPEWNATDEDKSTAIRVEERKTKNGKPYKMYIIENRDIYDLVNTLKKMCQKRSFVGAVLLGANASEFFTQDLEDMAIVPGDYVEIEPVIQPTKVKPVETDKQIIESLGFYDDQPVKIDFEKSWPVDAKMSYKTVSQMKNRDGENYIDLPCDKLANMGNAISKSIQAHPDADQKQMDTWQMKLDAIEILLKVKNCK
jgi:hypothetical protein